MNCYRYVKELSICLLFLTLFCTCTDEDPLTKEQLGELQIEEFRLGGKLFYKLLGNVSQNTTLTSDRAWVLFGGVNVVAGATLTIEPGTIIYGAFGEETAFLSVQQGAMIQANGTAEAPILFTSIRRLTSVPQPGDWGGIIINGSAPINAPGGIANGEGGTGVYGGNNPDDNSGSMRYVIVEYAGQQLGEDNELNSFSFNGVGSGTTLEYLESLYGKDDGFEFFGGTANLRYALSLGSGDDAFDWALGWQGKGQFWVAEQDPFDGDSGIEADNNEDNFARRPISNPTIANITLVGQSDGDNRNRGIILRRGTRGSISNALVANFANHGVQVSDAETLVHLSDGTLNLRSVNAFDNARVATTEGRNFFNEELLDSSLNNHTERSIVLQEGYRGVIRTGFVEVASEDDWFLPAPYLGAVDVNQDWTLGWSNPLR